MEKSLFTYFKECFTQNFVNFEGRARRKEYWSFFLFNNLISIFLFGFFWGLGTSIDFEALSNLAHLWLLVAFVPNLAVLARRLHDIGRSAWWVLIVFLPLIGGLILLYWLICDSQPGANKWGENPKGY